MLKKYKNKFVDRGVYFILKGEYKGCFILNIKELDSDDEKVFTVFPDQDILKLTLKQVETLFNDNYFEYVKRLPKKVYNVCSAQIEDKFR